MSHDPQVATKEPVSKTHFIHSSLSVCVCLCVFTTHEDGHAEVTFRVLDNHATFTFHLTEHVVLGDLQELLDFIRH